MQPSMFAAWVSLLTQLVLGMGVVVMFQGQVGLNFYGASSSDSQDVLSGGTVSDIGNAFKNHITIIETNCIAIYIDIELLSSPS